MKVIFYCNAVSDEIRNARRILSDSPAATRKVVGLCKACRAVGIDARIVSMGRGQVSNFGWDRVRQGEIECVPVTYGPMLHVPILSYVVTALWMFWFAFRHRGSKQDTVHLFYNQLTMYLPSLVLLNFMGFRTAVDIEDGPLTRAVEDKYSYRSGFGANASPQLFARFVNNGALLANSSLARGTPINRTCAYYGAIDTKVPQFNCISFPIKILVSGTLEPSTGMQLLADAIKIMDELPQASSFEINITGRGSSVSEMKRVKRNLQRLRVNVLGRIDADAYEELVRKSDIGLSLKPVGGAYADSTFPSKIIEYAENGLMVVCTDVSDIRILFRDCVKYLTSNDPAELAKLIIDTTSYPSDVRRYGKAAYNIVESRLSYTQSGNLLKKFFFGEEI